MKTNIQVYLLRHVSYDNCATYTRRDELIDSIQLQDTYSLLPTDSALSILINEGKQSQLSNTDLIAILEDTVNICITIIYSIPIAHTVPMLEYINFLFEINRIKLCLQNNPNAITSITN